ncbi:ABC transporter permease [Staphylococcus shinii]|uniref:YhgE/Pip domain-containing protein n=1 Tax=Staphylococcus shinii TaxID=2912228 RepID=UPI003F54C29C
MNIFKSKLLWIAPIAILVILVIFSIAFYPAYNPKPKELPIAIVNQDKGTSIQNNDINIGKKLEDNLLNSDSNTVKWVEVDNEKEARKGIDEQKYFGAAIFEKDFSKHAMSKTQKVIMDSKKQEMQDKVKSGEIQPEQAKQMQSQMAKSGASQDITVKRAEFKTLINNGANMQASQISTNVLKGIGDNLNKQITQQSLDTLEKQGVKVNASDIKGLTNPVEVADQKIHKVKDHQGNGNASFLMFMPVWISSIVASILLFFAFRTSNNIKVTHRLIASLGQIAIGVMTWLGMKSIPIFFIAMFFSMQLVMFPKQMLPKFYQDYIVSWNPFTHYGEYLRELLYMNQPLEMNGTMWMFIGFIIFGIVSSLSAAIIRKHSGKRTEVPS